MQVLEFEQLYLADLPDSHNYEKSFMHRDVVTFTAVAGNTDFAVTASCDGHVKFWYELIMYTLRRPVMREVLSTRIWGVPPAGGPLL